MAKENESEDIISLEDLVQEGEGTGASIAGAPVPPLGGVASDEAEPEAPKMDGGAPAEISVEQIDNLLAAEDPEFAASLQDIQSADMNPDEGGEIDPLDIDKAISEPHEGPKSAEPVERKGFVAKLKGFFSDLDPKTLAKDALARLKGALGVIAGALKGAIKSFIGLPLKSKILVVLVIALAGALFFVVRLTTKGNYLPDMQTEFLNGFHEVADQVYEYGPGDQMEDFQNPLLHPENVVLIERMVVNLKQPGDGTNPMGMFELYIETASKDTAIEIKDREVEARDVISRTLEQMPYDELITVAGKTKLKVILRKNLNEFLTKGRVRKIFFKTMVLKP